MNARAIGLGVPAVLVLALSACAQNANKVEVLPDDRSATCYTTDVFNKYNCETTIAPYGYPSPGARYDPFWDPWFSYGFGYQWQDRGSRDAVVYPYPVNRGAREQQPEAQQAETQQP